MHDLHDDASRRGTFALRHRTLGAARTISFTVACPGITALQEALARLGYLPYTLHGFVGASSTAALTRKQAARRAYALPPREARSRTCTARRRWRWARSTRRRPAALEVFEGDHNLPITTTPSAALWAELLADETLGAARPQAVHMGDGDRDAPGDARGPRGSQGRALEPRPTPACPAPTPQQGIFPIYVRYVATTMIGTNVDGSHYDDPGVPWVNYFNGGDAVHGYVRPGYGYPQSNGCVELPIATAADGLRDAPARRPRDRLLSRRAASGATRSRRGTRTPTRPSAARSASRSPARGRVQAQHLELAAARRAARRRRADTAPRAGPARRGRGRRRAATSPGVARADDERAPRQSSSPTAPGVRAARS